MFVLPALHWMDSQNMQDFFEILRSNSQSEEKHACTFCAATSGIIYKECIQLVQVVRTSELSSKYAFNLYKYCYEQQNYFQHMHYVTYICLFQSYIASGIFFSPWSKLNDEVMFLFTIRLKREKKDTKNVEKQNEHCSGEVPSPTEKYKSRPSPSSFSRWNPGEWSKR